MEEEDLSPSSSDVKEEQVVKKSSSQVLPVRKTAKLPDVVSIEKKLVADDEDKKNKGRETHHYNEPFSEDQLKLTWNRFLDGLKADDRSSEYNALNQKFQLEDSHTIRLEIINSYQLHMIERVRTELLEFLREQLKNKKIVLRTEVVEPEEKKMVYTNTEKFKFLAEKYPLMNELKKRLGLETDF